MSTAFRSDFAACTFQTTITHLVGIRDIHDHLLYQPNQMVSSKSKIKQCCAPQPQDELSSPPFLQRPLPMAVLRARCSAAAGPETQSGGPAEGWGGTKAAPEQAWGRDT